MRPPREMQAERDETGRARLVSIKTESASSPASAASAADLAHLDPRRVVTVARLRTFARIRPTAHELRRCVAASTSDHRAFSVLT